MNERTSMLKINVVLDISAQTIETIVETSKNLTGRDERGRYRVDTADKVGELISRFLEKQNFQSFVENPDNYSE